MQRVVAWAISIKGLLLLALVLPFALAGCKTPRERVAAHQADLQQQWQSNVVRQSTLPARVLDWNSAVQVMLDHNLKLRLARADLTNAQETVRQIFKDLIPSLNLRAGITKRVTDLDAISPDDLTFNADSFFNIPGIVGFNARLYAARLYELRARAAYRLAEREQMIELFRLFYDAEEYRDEEERLNMQRATTQAMLQVDPFAGRLMETELESRDIGLAREAKGLQDRAAEVLGSREFLWGFATNGLPQLNYDQAPLPLTDTNRVAQLQLMLLAVELEAARAQLFGLKLRHWPELNIFVSSPPIYQIRSGDEYWWDADEVRASADVFWSIDTRGNLRRSIRQLKRQQELQRERYRQESLALINRLIFTQDLIKTVRQQLARIEAQLQILTSVGPAQDFFSIQKYTVDFRSLTQQQLQLRRELSELNAMFWFVDEHAWRQQPTAMPPTI